MGTRSDGKPLATIDKDHPHACGDKAFFVQSSFFEYGIIPTRVGTSFVEIA